MAQKINDLLSTPDSLRLVPTNMKKICFVLALIVFTSSADAQPFIDEINAYQHEDSINPLRRNPILFVGSSSFRLWKDYQSYFPGYTIMNRGVGGSSLPDIIRYTDQIIIPYQPRQILIYCGENDFASSDTVTAAMVVGRFRELFTKIRKQLPKVPIAYVSIKPSPSRAMHREKSIEANEAIRQYLSVQSKASFINVWDVMLGEDGKPLPDIFLKDSLHMNAQGYTIWQKQITKYLIRKDR